MLNAGQVTFCGFQNCSSNDHIDFVLLHHNLKLFMPRLKILIILILVDFNILSLFVVLAAAAVAVQVTIRYLQRSVIK